MDPQARLVGLLSLEMASASASRIDRDCNGRDPADAGPPSAAKAAEGKFIFGIPCCLLPDCLIAIP